MKQQWRSTGSTITRATVLEGIPLTQFRNDEFVRVWPSEQGTFDCSPKNYVTFEADYLGG